MWKLDESRKRVGRGSMPEEHRKHVSSGGKVAQREVRKSVNRGGGDIPFPIEDIE